MLRVLPSWDSVSRLGVPEMVVVRIPLAPSSAWGGQPVAVGAPIPPGLKSNRKLMRQLYEQRRIGILESKDGVGNYKSAVPKAASPKPPTTKEQADEKKRAGGGLADAALIAARNRLRSKSKEN